MERNEMVFLYLLSSTFIDFRNNRKIYKWNVKGVVRRLTGLFTLRRSSGSAALRQGQSRRSIPPHISAQLGGTIKNPVGLRAAQMCRNAPWEGA
jgi:hypothetical protein